MQFRFCFFLMLFGAVLGFTSRNLQAITINDQAERYAITPRLILEDPTNGLSIHDIRSNHPGFKKVEKAPEYTTSTIWIQLPFENLNNREKDWVLVLTTDIPEDMELFAISDKGVRTSKTGLNVPFAKREVPYHYFAFQVTLAPGSDAVCWLRIHTKYPIRFETHLYSAGEFRIRDRREQSAFAFYYGIAAVMILYNLVLAVFLRSKAYLYYVSYIFCLATYLCTLNGISLEYILPDYPLWNLRLSLISAAMALLTALQFTRYFLETRERFPRLNVFLNILMVLSGIYVLTNTSLDYKLQNYVGRILTLIVSVSIFAGGVHAYRAGYKPARYFLVAWGFVLLGAVLFTLPGLGLMDRNFATRYGIQIGSGIEMVLLSVALSDRINTLRYQRDIAEARSKSVDRELRIARDIQLSLLPARVPDVHGLKVNASYIPARVVGGDYYDFYNISPTQIGIIIADVAGHGVPAALIASMLKIAFSNQREIALTPTSVITEMNSEMKGKYQDQYISAGYALIDMEEMVLHYATAGHPCALVYRAGEVAIEVESRGRLLGWQEDLAIVPASFPLKGGDRVLLYTDGVVEARNENDELFGLHRVSELLESNKLKDGQAFLDEVRKGLLKWIHPRPSFEDDVTMVVIDVQK